jgi:putative membrane protein
MWAGMMLWMLVFWVGILVLAFAVASWLFPAVPALPHPTAREILDARYARGELTQEQYRQMQRELAPDSRRGRHNVNILIVALVLVAALVVVSDLGMHGGWSGPGYPGRPGEWPSWMPHMWGR